MKFSTKQEVCDWVNQKLTQQRKLADDTHKLSPITDFVDWFGLNFLRPKQVKVPIYTSPWKLKLLKRLRNLFYYQEQLQYGNVEIDFSRLVWPDQWKIYPFEDTIALPKFTKKHQSCWEIMLEHEFYKEDLQFGVRPSSVHRYTIDFGTGPLLIDNNNGDIYKLGSGFMFSDYINSFEHYLQGTNPHNTQWELYKM